MQEKRPPRPTRWGRLFVLALLVLAYVLIVNAWVVDDAYITFRTVDNFVNGHGLRWNVDERVQVYTHPLWMFTIALAYLFTSEVFYTVIVVSLVFTLASVLLASAAVTRRFHRDAWKPVLLVLVLISSKATIDYASSGLENPLSYLIAVLFFAKLLSTSRAANGLTSKDLGQLVLLVSLAFLNRADTALLYLPALVYALLTSRALPLKRRVGVIALALLPAVAWVLFSLVYYGYPFPNTAYAKVLCTGFPLSWRIERGFEYLANSFLWDTASHVLVVAAAVCSIRRRSAPLITLACGVLLYIVFVICSGASATHMSGRFFAVPFFMTAVIFVESVTRPRVAATAGVALIVYSFWSPISALKFGTDNYTPYSQRSTSTIDAKWFVKNEGAALINWRPGKQLPDHEWYRYGFEIRNKPETIHAGGAGGGDAIGYAGFAAGPAKHIVDSVALADPLLARLPAKRPARRDEWKSGHFRRTIPEGYFESLASGRNQIRDENIRRYYDAVRTLTRGPLFSLERFKVIWNMNLGRYEHLLAQLRSEQSGSADEP